MLYSQLFQLGPTTLQFKRNIFFVICKKYFIERMKEDLYFHEIVFSSAVLAVAFLFRHLFPPVAIVSLGNILEFLVLYLFVLMFGSTLVFVFYGYGISIINWNKSEEVPEERTLQVHNFYISVSLIATGFLIERVYILADNSVFTAILIPFIFSFSYLSTKKNPLFPP